MEALHTLSQLFLGKTGIFDHNMKTGNQAARIYDTAMETMEGKRTSFGEPYTRLVAKAYLPRCEKNTDLIMEIESGMKKEVSVGCAVAERICSVCGASRIVDIPRAARACCGESARYRARCVVCCA